MANMGQGTTAARKRMLRQRLYSLYSWKMLTEGTEVDLRLTDSELVTPPKS